MAVAGMVLMYLIFIGFFCSQDFASEVENISGVCIEESLKTQFAINENTDDTSAAHTNISSLLVSIKLSTCFKEVYTFFSSSDIHCFGFHADKFYTKKEIV